MTLKRDDWAKMWESIKSIEKMTEDIYTGERLQTTSYRDGMRRAINHIKKQIQTVIGKME